jgi:hypothetical protein
MNREQAMRGAGDVIGCIPADTLRDPVTADAERARIAALDKARGDGWQPIETAPHEELLVLGWFEGDVWKQEIALASAGQRFENGYSNRWQHGRATRWHPLPAPPSDPFAEWVKPFEGEG